VLPRLVSVIMLVICGSVCCIAALSLRHKPTGSFSWNPFLVASAYLGMWFPVSLGHFLSYEPFHIFLPLWAVEVRNRQAADMIGAVSAVVTIIIRLSHNKIRDTLFMSRGSSLRVGANRNMTSLIMNEVKSEESGSIQHSL